MLCWGPCVRAAFLAALHAGSLICSTTLTSRGREGSPATAKHPFPAVLSIPSPWSQASLPQSLLASLPWVPEHLIPVVPCCPSLQSHAAHPCSLMLPMCRNAPGMESSITSSSLPTLGAVVPLPHPKQFQKRGGVCSYHLGTRTSAPRISHPCSTPGERSPGQPHTCCWHRALGTSPSLPCPHHQDHLAALRGPSRLYPALGKQVCVQSARRPLGGERHTAPNDGCPTEQRGMLRNVIFPKAARGARGRAATS